MELEWQGQAGFAAIVTREDLRLIVFVQQTGSQWGALSLEGPVTAEMAILENHAHKLIGQYPGVLEAIQAAEGFARAWVKKFKATKHEACECEEIPGLKDDGPQMFREEDFELVPGKPRDPTPNLKQASAKIRPPPQFCAVCSDPKCDNPNGKH